MEGASALAWYRERFDARRVELLREGVRHRFTHHRAEALETLRRNLKPKYPGPTQATVKRAFSLRRRGLSQERIGFMLGVSQTTVGRWLRGEVRATARCSSPG